MVQPADAGLYTEAQCRYDEAKTAYAALVAYQRDHRFGWALGFRTGRVLWQEHRRACVAHHFAVVTAMAAS